MCVRGMLICQNKIPHYYIRSLSLEKEAALRTGLLKA